MYNRAYQPRAVNDAYLRMWWTPATLSALLAGATDEQVDEIASAIAGAVEPFAPAIVGATEQEQ